MFDKIQVILMMKMSISNNLISRLNNIININGKDIASNKQFWKTIKSMFYDKVFMIKITLA